MSEYPEWVKGIVKDYKPICANKIEPEKLLENVKTVKQDLNDIIAYLNKDFLQKWAKLIDKVSSENQLTSMEAELRNSAINFVAFIEELNGCSTKLGALETKLQTPVEVPVKKAVRMQVERENVNLDDTFQVVDPSAIGEKRRDITLSLVTSREVIDNLMEEEYVVVMYWTDSLISLFKKEFNNFEQAQELYNSYKLKLAEVHANIQNNDLEQAEKTTKELLDTVKANSTPLIQETPNINNANE